MVFPFIKIYRIRFPVLYSESATPSSAGHKERTKDGAESLDLFRRHTGSLVLVVPPEDEEVEGRSTGVDRYSMSLTGLTGVRRERVETYKKR